MEQGARKTEIGDQKSEVSKSQSNRASEVGSRRSEPQQRKLMVHEFMSQTERGKGEKGPRREKERQ